MSLLMIHKAYMPVYSDPDFYCGTGRTDGPTKGCTRGPRGPKSLLHGMETELLYDLFTWLGDVENGFFRV